MVQNLIPSLIKDINPGNESSNPDFLGAVNGNLLFSTFNTSSLNTQLWKTDGSEAGTVLVTDFGNNSFPPSSVATVNNAVYFLLGTGFTSLSLFRSDGTAEGTIPVDGANLRLGATINNNLTGVGDSLFYTAVDGSFTALREKLFRIDNSISEPVLVQPEAQGRITSELTGVGNTLFFSDSVEANGALDIELWKSDGTDAGTVIVKDINPNDSSNPSNLTDIGGRLFFTADDGSNGRELWKSDGTEAGTFLIEDINSGSASSNVDNLTDVNGTAFFTAEDGSNGTELWKSDGTESGTSLVKDIFAGSGSSNPDNLTNVNGDSVFHC